MWPITRLICPIHTGDEVHQQKISEALPIKSLTGLNCVQWPINLLIWPIVYSIWPILVAKWPIPYLIWPIPHAIPPTIPMLGNYLIIMFKEVPLASTIGVVGMLHIANSYGSQYYKFVEPLTVTAIFFLLLSYPSALLIKKLEKKYNRSFDKKATTS